MLTLLSLSGAFTLGLTASSPPQHKLWEPCLRTHIPLCFMWPQAAHYPVSTLEPRCGLASFFLSSSQALGSLGIEPPSACSVLAYHLLPSSHPIQHSHTCMTSKASAGTRATDLEGHLINSLFLIGSLQILLGMFRAFFFPVHLQPPCLPSYWFPSPMYPSAVPQGPMAHSRFLSTCPQTEMLLPSFVPWKSLQPPVCMVSVNTGCEPHLLLASRPEVDWVCGGFSRET